jgi:hypothetical protein
VVAFIASLLITGLMTGIVLVFARRREPGRPLTWGEAFIGATFVFALLFMAYGVVPHHWLAWADNELNWRKDSIGIPTGPIPGIKNHTLFEDGLTFFGRGRILVTKEAVRDLIGTLIYGVFIVAHVLGWLAWQRRGQKPEAAIETSAYGRPLLRKT